MIFFVFLFVRNVKKTDKDQSILQAFLLAVSKETSHKPLKVAAAKKFFPIVFIIDTTCFDKCFLFHMITGNSIFYLHILLPRGLVQSPCC